MKLCYVVLAHANPAQLARTVDALRDGDNAVVVHVDARADLDAFQRAAGVRDVHWVADRVRPYHHSWGIVEATLRALRDARQSGADRYILLSGDSYPLRSQDYIRAYLARHDTTEWMNLLPLPAPQVLKGM